MLVIKGAKTKAVTPYAEFISGCGGGRAILKSEAETSNGGEGAKQSDATLEHSQSKQGTSRERSERRRRTKKLKAVMDNTHVLLPRLVCMQE